MLKTWTREEWRNRPVDLIGQDDCPFCDEKRDAKYILWKWKFWYVKLNKYPYTWNKYHVMVMPIDHYEFSHEVPSENWQEMPKVDAFLKEYFDGHEYFSFTRESFGNRSIKHLHKHVIYWEISPWAIIDTLKEQGKI